MVALSPITAALRYARRSLFGYDAIAHSNKRKPPSGILRTEDDEATDGERRLLYSGNRDIRRNYTLAAWMVRRHLDYVTTFNLKATTQNKALNKDVEALIARRSKPALFDAAGRHGRKRALRIAEACRTVDGDVLAVRLAAKTMQWIEGDRLRLGETAPEGIDPARFVHGVQIDGAGRAVGYAVCRRGGSGMQWAPGSNSTSTSFTFQRVVNATHAYLHGYFDRFDQVRGVSPLNTALNELRDTYEGFDLARAKMKVSQLFALAIFRDFTGDESPAAQQSSDDEGYEIDFGKGPTLLDLDAGDKAEFLESKTPSTEMQAFCNFTIMVALKALDIPFSFFAENFTNYSGSRGALLQYDRACESKRDDNRELLDWWTQWQLTLAIIDGELPGVDPADLRWEWIATGVPWIDPLKEILSKEKEVGMGVNSRTRICAERGVDWEDDILPELIHESQLLSDAGLPLNTNSDNALVAALTQDDAPNQSQSATQSK